MITVSLDKLELHPDILSIIPMEPLLALFQDLISAPSIRSILSFPILVTKKKGMRKNEKYWVVQNTLNYLAAFRLFQYGECVDVSIIVFDDLDTETIQNQFLLELTGYKRTSIANAVIATGYKRLEERRSSEQRPSFVKPCIKDTTHKRAHTLRKLSGYDGRAYNNALKAEDTLPQSVSEFIGHL